MISTSLMMLLLVLHCTLSQHQERIYFPDEIFKPKPRISMKPTISAPNFNSSIIQPGRIYFPDEIFKPKPRISEKPTISGIGCGSNEFLYHGTLLNSLEPVPVYYLNETAKKLAENGFHIIVGKVVDDVLYKFTYCNETNCDFLELSDHTSRIPSPLDGNSTILKSRFMARIGEWTGNETKWVCDGVLLNREWVLSSASCLMRLPLENRQNIVRLGDYDFAQPHEDKIDYPGQIVVDSPLAEVVFYPDFRINERYHDIVLIRILLPTPKYANNIKPICLPVKENMSGLGSFSNDVILTFWNTSSYAEQPTTILKEENLVIVDLQSCNKNYIAEEKHFPRGKSADTLLCVVREASEDTGCGGDEGSPLVFQNNQMHFLIGISTSYSRCGTAKYPSFYIPITEPHLRWIEETAFKQF